MIFLRLLHQRGEEGEKWVFFEMVYFLIRCLLKVESTEE